MMKGDAPTEVRKAVLENSKDKQKTVLPVSVYLFIYQKIQLSWYLNKDLKSSLHYFFHLIYITNVVYVNNVITVDVSTKKGKKDAEVMYVFVTGKRSPHRWWRGSPSPPFIRVGARPAQWVLPARRSLFYVNKSDCHNCNAWSCSPYCKVQGRCRYSRSKNASSLVIAEYIRNSRV